MPGLDQGRLQEPTWDDIIVGNEDLHATCAPLNTAKACPRWATSLSSSAPTSAACVKSPLRPMTSSLRAVAPAICAPKLITVPFRECAARSRLDHRRGQWRSGSWPITLAFLRRTTAQFPQASLYHL